MINLTSLLRSITQLLRVSRNDAAVDAFSHGDCSGIFNMTLAPAAPEASGSGIERLTQRYPLNQPKYILILCSHLFPRLRCSSKGRFIWNERYSRFRLEMFCVTTIKIRRINTGIM